MAMKMTEEPRDHAVAGKVPAERIGKGTIGLDIFFHNFFLSYFSFSSFLAHAPRWPPSPKPIRGSSKIQGYISSLRLWNDRPTEPHSNQTLRYPKGTLPNVK